MDIAIFRAIHLGWKNGFLDVLNLILSWSGLGVVIGLIAIIAHLHPKTKPYSVPVIMALILGGLVFAHGTKTLMPRLRPSNLSWAQPQEGHKQSSFPSAHTSAAFSAATVVSLLARKKRIAVLAMLWASGVGLSRIYRGVHWPSDVLAGACLGILAGCLVFLFTSRNQYRANT
jgi:membrane-associated phospholipid phosphatase